MIKVRVRWCTFKSVENVIILGKLIVLLLFCPLLLLLSIMFLKTPTSFNVHTRNELARLVMEFVLPSFFQRA